MNSFAFFGGMVFALAGAAALVLAIRRLRRARRSLSWPTVPGRIESVNLWGRRRVDGEMREVERLSVDFRYSFDGQVHRGAEVAMYTVVYPATVELAERFEAAQEVDVHVDPDRPSSAVLVAGPHPEKPYSEVILAASGLVIGAAVAISAALGMLS